MKIGFFGTPDIAARCLEFLIERHEIVFAVTSEDKRAGRSQRIAFCPAKEAALKRNIPVLQPSVLKDPFFMEELKKRPADIYVVVAYGRIIPKEVFENPPLKTINLHPSLLPRYRGAAPVEWAIIRGEEVTGVTVQVINERLDAGDIIVQEEVDIGGDMTAGDLYGVVIPMGAQLIERAIGLLASGTAALTAQDEKSVTYCGKIGKETAKIDWSLPWRRIHDLVRGLNPKPVAWTLFRDKTVRIWKTVRFTGEAPALGPGSLLRYQKRRLLVGTGGGCMEIMSIHPENRDPMDGLSFINGYRIAEGDRFL